VPSLRKYFLQRAIILFSLTFAAILCTTLGLSALGLHWTIVAFGSLIPAVAGLIALIVVTERSADNVSRALQTIVETSDAICNGASAARISVDSATRGELGEIANVYQAVNRLADKQVADIQEMKKLETVRSEFLANVSHELRTPIFSIQGFLETLLDGALDDNNVSRQFVEKAYSNTLRLNVLLTDLIDISRIESGAMKFSFRYFPIIPLVQEILRNLEPTAQANGISVRLDGGDLMFGNETTVFGDRDRLAQVLTNLIENAIKYNVANGSVIVKVERAAYSKHEAGVQISVCDTGIGIAPEYHKRIFERFYRVDKARSRRVGGTGLGLAIVKHILEAHKAPICVQSEVNKGTCMSFTLKQ
jgi:two-component system phosphate regulon sensor histidine kinase PhoR